MNENNLENKNPSSIPEKVTVKAHFDEIAHEYDYWKNKNRYYYDNIKNFIKTNVHPNARVLEIGCGTGEILDSTNPGFGVGIDISDAMIAIARKKYPQYEFYSSPIEDFSASEKFDYIIMVDVMDHVYDIQDVFLSLEKLCHPLTKIILTTISPWWDPILKISEKFKLKMPEGPNNFVDIRAIKNILAPLNFDMSYSGYMLLFPKYIPLLSYVANTIGVRTIGLRRLAPVQYMIVRPTTPITTNLNMGCTVVIPCHNEAGNIQEAIKRVPHMGTGTEIIVINDGSTDDTALRVRELMPYYGNLKLIDYSPNEGKGEAVRKGLNAASKEIVMILDADISVSPEELPRFFEPLNKGICQFVNGTRMVYPMESQAMRTLNLFGNKLFSQIMSFILNQKVTDTLCGTKAFYKSDYKYMDLRVDKWGDYDFLFSAAKMGLTIVEVPVHYKDRLEGESKMKTFRHGFHLLCACFKGFKYLVIVPPTKPRELTEEENAERLKREIAHGKHLAEVGKGDMWYWSTPAGQIRLKRRISMLCSHINATMDVLEVGCGTGYVTQHLARTAAYVTAIDISPDLLAHAKERIAEPNIRFLEANAYDLPFDDNSFDTIVGSAILHHLDFDKALSEFKRVLKPGGTLYFTEPNMLNPHVYLERKFPYLKKHFHVSDDETAFYKKQLVLDITKHGFVDVTVEPFDFLHPLTPQILIPSVKFIGELCEKIPLISEIAGSHYIHAKKQ